uniref:G-protein coupled receptors family 1 profile domain-containing protein n=1 Tax=Timema poppense TaxID=170557 RepID=A0A7R9DKI1_TIMPO|nr:unnamed protein product [Timema poppensis]
MTSSSFVSGSSSEDLCLVSIQVVCSRTSYTSVLTIVAFSMERYLAICHPLHSYTMSNLERAWKIIAFLWLLSLVSAVPFAVFTSVNYVNYPPGSLLSLQDSNNPVLESAFCAMLDENIPVDWPIYEMSSFIFFIVPMLVILVLYILMGLKIRSRTNQALGKRFSSTSSDRNRTWDSRTKSILRMLG